MNDIDDRLVRGLHDLVDGEPDSAPDVRALIERGRQGRRRRATALAGTTCALLALGVGTAVTVTTNAPPERPGVTAQAAQPVPPALRLVSAATASENISYRMRLTNSGPGGLTYEGAFDPRTATGYVRVPHDDSIQVELLIDGTRYEGAERPQGELPPEKGPGETYGRYGQYPGRYDRLSLQGDGNAVLGAAAPDPAALFAALRSANATVTENPDGTLHFAYTTADRDGSTSTAGDVTLDRDSRIAMVALTFSWQSTAKGRLDQGTSTSTLQLFDYGVPVQVERPTDIVMMSK
ncbi:hypothetical protein [Micromonospora sp. NPDC005172]|uniref:hypothetical protein n=1 Tax=Micromonospora sp. NPDC005172 TaxID=3156867 RepID=UPI0033BB7315